MKKQYRSLAFLGYPNHMVSNFGHVYHVRGDPSRGKPYRWCRMKPRELKRIPYQRVGLCGRMWLVHRLVLLAFVGPCPPGMETRHLDRDPRNNRLDNLLWGTPKKNAKDKKRHGTNRKGVANHKNAGEGNGRAVLTNRQAEQIRKEHIPKVVTYKMLAKKYGVSHWTIMELVNGQTY